MHTLRTKFKNEIVSEFLAPHKKSNKVIILCDGMPSVPCKKPLLEFFSKKGFWVFHPRYRGTWESSGEFLKISPHQDILDIIDQLPKGFVSLWDNKLFKLKPEKIFVFGSSFGGAMAILTLLDQRVAGVVAFSPVVNWRVENRTELHSLFKKFLKEAFGGAYRFSDKNLRNFKSDKLLSPVDKSKNMNGRKLLIIHARNDDVVSWKPVERFAKSVGSKIILVKRGGHFSLSAILKPLFYSRIKKFLHGKQ